jgi:hypothetical protein
MNTEELKTYAGLFGSMNDIFLYLAQGNDDDLLAKYLSTSPEHAYLYAKYVIKGRWPEAEEVLSKSTHYAYHYARHVIKGRWPEGEKAIAKDPGYAYHYARHVIKGRFPEAEKTLLKDPERAYNYANNVIKERVTRYKFLCMVSFYKLVSFISNKV